MFSSPYANPRKRSSGQDHYDPFQHTTRRPWRISRPVVPSEYLHSAQAGHTSPQLQPDPHPYEFSPLSSAFSPRPTTSLLDFPRIRPTSPTYIPDSPKCSPTSSAFTPDSPKFSPNSPILSTVSPHYGRGLGWSEYHLGQTAPEDSKSPKFTPSSPKLGTVSPRYSRTIREQNVSPETPDSSPNNPIDLSPVPGPSHDAILFTSDDETIGAMRSEGSNSNGPGSSPAPLRNPFTPNPKIQYPTPHKANLASGLNSQTHDENESQSLAHRYRSTTLKVAPTPALKTEVDKAISWADKLGDPYLGRAVHDVYERSMKNPRVARLMISVLTQTPTVEEENEFQAWIQSTRTHFIHVDERMASPSLAEDFESDNEETHESLVGKGISVDPEDTEESDGGYDVPTTSFPSVPSSPSTLKDDEVQDDLSAEAVWGAISVCYMQE